MALILSKMLRSGLRSTPRLARRSFSAGASSEKKKKQDGWTPAQFLTGVAGAVVALATQDLAKEIAGGIAVMFRQKDVAVGDKIQLKDGKVGYVERLGWVSSTVRGLDDIYIEIPNSLLVRQPLINISHAKRSQVKQTIRFKYKDLDKIPELLQDIKDQVKEECPKLVTEGAAYRAVITSYESDHVAAMVNFHFEIPSQTEAFHRNRQHVLLVIANVMKKHRVEFAVPMIETRKH